MLTYSIRRRVSPAQFLSVLQRSTLAERRPVHDADCLRGMIEHANLIATCWEGRRLVGIARSVTDFHYCCYLSDLAVDQAYQRRGIGVRLIHLTREALGPHATLILLSAPAATRYYPHLGFTRHPQAWLLGRRQPLQARRPRSRRRPAQ